MINLISKLINDKYRKNLDKDNNLKEELLNKENETFQYRKDAANDFKVIDQPIYSTCSVHAVPRNKMIGVSGASGFSGIAGNSGYSTNPPIDYVKYISDKIDNSVEYTKYIEKNLDKSINYANYISEKIDNGWMSRYAEEHKPKSEIKRVYSEEDPYGEEIWEE